MSGRLQDSALGRNGKSTEAKTLLLNGVNQANLAQVLAFLGSSTISKAEGASLLRSLLQINATSFEGEISELPRFLEARSKQLLGDSAAWLRADRSRAEAIGVAFLIAIRSRILELARTHLSFAGATVALAETHQHTIIQNPAKHSNGAITTLGHCLLTYVYPAFRDLERLQHCYRSFNSSSGGAGRTATGVRLPVDLELLRSLLGFDECRSPASETLWHGDGPIELMAAIIALLVNLNRLADDLRPFVTTSDSSDLAWIRSLTSELLSKVPDMASLGKEHDGNAEAFVSVTDELCTAFDGTVRAVGLLTSLVKKCAENAVVKSQLRISSARQTDLEEVFVTRGGIDYATAEKMVQEIDRLISRRELEIDSLTPEGIDVLAIQLTGQRLNLTASDLQSAIHPESVIEARRGPGGVSPERMIEMITECRARLVRENLWVTVAVQKLTKSDALLAAAAQEAAEAG